MHPAKTKHVIFSCFKSVREHAALSLNFMCNISWGGCWAWFRYMCGYTLKCVYKDILIAFGARSRKLSVNGVNMYLVSLDTKFEWNGLRRASYAIHSLVLTKFPLRCGPELYIWLVGLNLCMCVCVWSVFEVFVSNTYMSAVVGAAGIVSFIFAFAYYTKNKVKIAFSNIQVK